MLRGALGVLIYVMLFIGISKVSCKNTEYEEVPTLIGTNGMQNVIRTEIIFAFIA